MKLSIIIPALKETENLKKLLPYLKRCIEDKEAEIILSGPEFESCTEILCANLGVKIIQTKEGRAIQMNEGVMHSRGEVLYFLHADTKPPISFYEDVMCEYNNGFLSGCFKFRFDSKNPFLKINSWFTQFNLLAFRGGDQSLFIDRILFEKLGGYDEEYIIMEEYALIKEARKRANFKVIQKEIVVSARKYESNSYLKVNVINFCAFFMYRHGVSPMKIQRFYYNNLSRSFSKDYSG